MGFDNECILNIQSLAGEYFCPVCRLLVYPHEAIQSQCTHLYCKPCLTYVVSTTSACPYDGYLVTEADAKPLLESNKALADTIGKIEIHCLYHRSGCTWQGPLSDCTSHCSGCTFGNSPVVCNRCGIQIVHREVQEHAQNCPGVQSQAQQAVAAPDVAVTGTSSATDQNQTAAQAGAVSSQAQTSQSTATVIPGKDGGQQANTNPQASLSTPDQWYQQQQQYQQYYQQFPGYDPYQQQYQMYYPYQQPAAPQYQQQQMQTHPPQTGQQQPPMQVQPPPAPSQPLAQVPTSAPPQNQIQANPPQQNHPAVQPYSQIQSQAPPPPHPHQYPQAQPTQNPQHIQPQYQHPQIPQYQQPHPQMQPTQSQPSRFPAPQHQSHPQAQPPVQLQNHPQPQPQPQPHQTPAQNPSAHGITGHHSYPQPQLHQQMQPGAAHQHSMHMQPQAGPYRPPQHPVQMQGQFSQHPPQMRPPLSHTPIQNAPPVQQQPIYPHAQQPGHAIHQHPGTQVVQQPMPQQYVQQQQPQPFVGQPSVSVQNQLNQQGPFTQQQLPMPPQIRPQAPAQHLHAYPQPHQNVAMPHGAQAHQSHFVGGRPTMPNEGVQSQSYAQSAGGEVRPTQQSANQHSTSQVKVTTEQLKPAIPADEESKSPAQQMAKKGINKFDGLSYPKVDAGDKIPMKSETDMKNGNEPKSVSEVDEKTRVGASAKEIQEPMKTVDIDVKSKQLENREPVVKQELNGEANLSNLEMANDGKSGEIMAIENKGLENNDLKDGSGLKKYSSMHATEPSGEQHGKLAQTPGTQGHGLDEYGGLPPPGQGRHPPSFQHHRPGAPLSHFPPSQHHTAAAGHTSNQFGPQGSLPGTEVPPGVISGPGSTASFGRGPSHYGPHGPHVQGHMHPSHAGALRPSQGDPFMGPPPPGTSEYDSHAGMMAKPPPHGRQHPVNFEQGAFGVHSNMNRLNGAPGLDSSLPHGLRDERFKPPTDDHLNPFPADPNRLIMDHGDFEDGKRFPRHSLDAESVSKSGSYFSSSRPVDMGSIMRSESTRSRPDFLRPVPGYGGHHMDGLASRSPPRDYPGISPRGFGGLTGIPGSRSGLEEVDGRHRFGDPYNDGRFRGLPGHMHRGEFEGTGNSRMGEHLRSGDLIDRNFLPSHLRRGEHFGPRHMLEEPAGYDHFLGHVPRGELGAPGGNFSHHLPPSKSFGGGRPNQRPDEPGFQSNFPLQGYPHDGGIYTGDMNPFDNLRKRKPANMGWCRICKVDCETVEGLDLHAQTREHQKNAMDMVLTIKQNAKKQKSISRDPSSFEDANKSRNANFGSRGNMR